MPRVGFRAGDIHLIDDSALYFPKGEQRKPHDERRRFIILTNSDISSNTRWPTITGCPISSSTKQRTEHDFKVPFGKSGIIKDSWVRVPAIQSVPRTALEDFTGYLEDEYLENLYAKVIKYMGLI